MRKAILGFLMFFLSVLVVDASSKYEILSDYMDVSVLENGDLHVKELVVVDGDFVEFQHSLYYRNSRLEKHDEFDYTTESLYNASSLEDTKVSIKEFGSKHVRFLNIFDFDYEVLEKAYFKEDIKESGYIESSMQDGKSIKVYHKSKDGVVGFLFEYTLKDVVVLHKDIAEINYLFLAPLEQEVGNYEIRLHLGEDVDYLKMWAHGDLSSQVSYLDDMAIASYSKVPKNSKLSFRAVFSRDEYMEVKQLKQSNLISLKKIIEIEEKKAKIIDGKKKQTLLASKAILMVDSIFITFLVSYFVFVTLKYGSEYESSFKDKYYKSIPRLYGVEVLDALWHKKIRKESFLESLLCLIYRKNIVVLKRLHQLELKSRDNISMSEEVLLDILFEKIGSNNKVKESEVLKLLGHSSKKEYEKYYQRWYFAVQKEIDKNHFYEKNGLPIVSSVFFVLLSVFVLMSSFYFKVEFWFSLLNTFASILFMIYAMTISKKTKYGVEELFKLNGLKRYIQDYSLEESLDLEEYLIYSMVFGLQDEFYGKTKGSINSLGSYYIDLYHKLHMRDDF